jgi:DNA-binding transcriptional LysR family regulator
MGNVVKAPSSKGGGAGLDLRHLQTFQVVAATKNFNRAAAQLGYSQSSVTTHIQLLESALGRPLFERERFSKSVVLTEFGRRTMKTSEKLLALAAEVQASALAYAE